MENLNVRIELLAINIEIIKNSIILFKEIYYHGKELVHK